MKRKIKTESRNDTAVTDVLLKASSALDNMQSRRQDAPRRQQDECDVFGQLVASTLREITNKKTQALCRLKVQELLYNYQFAPCSTSTQPPYQPPQTANLAPPHNEVPQYLATTNQTPSHNQVPQYQTVESQGNTYANL